LYIYKAQCNPNNYPCIMKKVSDILKRKGRSVVTIDAATTVLDALKLMADKNIGSVIISEHGKYLGLMTERDYARKVILLGRSSHETPVREIMSESNIRYLPVFVDDELSGIVSINDLVTETILSHLETIEHLKTYIQS